MRLGPFSNRDGRIQLCQTQRWLCRCTWRVVRTSCASMQLASSAAVGAFDVAAYLLVLFARDLAGRVTPFENIERRTL